MLDSHLIAKVSPKANKENIIFWKNYRITVLQDCLFRLEYSKEKVFRDEATQVVWFRDMPKQNFSICDSETELILKTKNVELIINEKRQDCRIRINDGVLRKINNAGNLKGTARTLDGYDGEFVWFTKNKIKLETGVCSRSGIAVIDDSKSLSLSEDGLVLPTTANGTDEYVFAFGNDYRGAVCALYEITGKTPLVPRFALGNWWSRYHPYSQDEYIRLINQFEERKIPLTVATVDMDWHWSAGVDKQKKIIESGKDTKEYIGDIDVSLGWTLGWTGYSWNTELFYDYKKFFKDLHAKNLAVTLNLHPAEGVRWWEDMYEEFAYAMDVDPTTQKQIPFDVTNDRFLNNYFSILHKPYEKDGVDFWWIDWQSGQKSAIEGLDPLWSINHYHYLDIASNHFSPLILSRYSGVGSHRYPLGFSGDTMMSWSTLKYLPKFTATATNIGYTWWSHDIGGHCLGEKDDEMYVRHVQYGVFSPINRLHCTIAETVRKEPKYYMNGTGYIAEEWLRFRHTLIPFLYSCSYRTYAFGEGLIEPLYYEWDCDKAYKYDTQYLFGKQLLVIPIVNKRKADGWARVKVWIPEGKWTDIFTGDEYDIANGGEERVLLRDLNTIPVLIRSGGILLLSRDEGNSVENPKKLDICVWAGTNEYVLYEDGRTSENCKEFYTKFSSAEKDDGDYIVQTLEIFSSGDASVVPQNRMLRVLFKDIHPNNQVDLYKNGELISVEKCLTDSAAIEFKFDYNAKYLIKVKHGKRSWLEKQKERSLNVIACLEGDTTKRSHLWSELGKTTTIEEYSRTIEESDVKGCLKARLKETI